MDRLKYTGKQAGIRYLYGGGYRRNYFWISIFEKRDAPSEGCGDGCGRFDYCSLCQDRRCSRAPYVLKASVKISFKNYDFKLIDDWIVAQDKAVMTRKLLNHEESMPGKFGAVVACAIRYARTLKSKKNFGLYLIRKSLCF